MRGATVQMIALRDLEPNPYRHIERYVISEEKVAALVQSYQNSGFWNGSLQVRPHPRREGKYQLAFGHHRCEAAKRSKLDAIGCVVSARTNADMLRMMADENRSEFKHDALVGIETIGAVVDAYAKGEIELEAVGDNARGAGGGIYETNFAPAKLKRYTLATVARFLGWVQADGQPTRACRSAFDAYRERATTEEATLSLAPGERSEAAVEIIVGAARAARKQAQDALATPSKVREAERRAANEAARRVKRTSDTKDIRGDSKLIGAEAVRAVLGKKAKDLPGVEIYVSRLTRKCESVEPYADILTECRRTGRAHFQDPRPEGGKGIWIRFHQHDLGKGRLP